MNNNHYPSLELCKKLNENNFPETDKVINERNQIGGKFDFLYIPEANPPPLYPCPSVMEMLDVIPNAIQANQYYLLKFVRLTKQTGRFEGETIVEYRDGQYKLIQFYGYFPNALAEMVLWLVANDYLSFN